MSLLAPVLADLAGGRIVPSPLDEGGAFRVYRHFENRPSNTFIELAGPARPHDFYVRALPSPFFHGANIVEREGSQSVGFLADGRYTLRVGRSVLPLEIVGLGRNLTFNLDDDSTASAVRVDLLPTVLLGRPYTQGLFLNHEVSDDADLPAYTLLHDAVKLRDIGVLLFVSTKTSPIEAILSDEQKKLHRVCVNSITHTDANWLRVNTTLGSFNVPLAACRLGNDLAELDARDLAKNFFNPLLRQARTHAAG